VKVVKEGVKLYRLQHIAVLYVVQYTDRLHIGRLDRISELAQILSPGKHPLRICFRLLLLSGSRSLKFELPVNQLVLDSASTAQCG
jgi:hypothetical protein